jgi:multidrug transporter EmrE-like cation transporter
MKYGLLAFAIVLNACANIMMKLGALKLGSISGLSVTDFVVKFITNYYLLFGIFLFAINIFLYIIILTKINISIVYPIWTSGGFLLISLLSVLYLKESLSVVQIIGIFLVASGITLLAYKF